MDKGRSNKRQMKMKTEGTKIYECTKRSTKFYTDKCFPGRLMSAASIQKLFCGIYSAFKFFLMYLWGREWSPHPIPPASSIIFLKLIFIGVYSLYTAVSVSTV